MRRLARAIIVRGEQLLVIKRDNHGKKYFTLPGGGIEEGESPDVAAIREVKEETSIVCNVIREVYHEVVDEFGETYYFLCDYVSGEPALTPDTSESVETAKGENTYIPMWLEIRALGDTIFLPRAVANRLESDLDNDFSYKVVQLSSEKEGL